MTPNELTAFYRELDRTERDPRRLSDAGQAEYFAQDAIASGLKVDDACDAVRVLARLAFRFALRELRQRERAPWGNRYAGMGMRSAMRQWREDQ